MRKEDFEKMIRGKIGSGFDDTVNDVVDDLKGGSDTMKNSMIIGIMVESAIANFYTFMKEGMTALAQQCHDKEIDFDKILEEEYRKALNRYLE